MEKGWSLVILEGGRYDEKRDFHKNLPILDSIKLTTW